MPLVLYLTEVSTILWILSSVVCPLPSILSPLSSVICPLSSVICPPPSVICPLSSALCHLSSDWSLFRYSRKPPTSLLFPISSDLCHLSSDFCRLLSCFLFPDFSFLYPMSSVIWLPSSALSPISCIKSSTFTEIGMNYEKVLTNSEQRVKKSLWNDIWQIIFWVI